MVKPSSHGMRSEEKTRGTYKVGTRLLVDGLDRDRNLGGESALAGCSNQSSSIIPFMPCTACVVYEVH